MNKLKFGSAGNPDAFYEAGLKRSWEIPAWLAAQSLGAYEYSAGRGVRLNADTAGKIGQQARAYNIAVSVHAPYFINLATIEPEKMVNNEKYLVDSINAAEWLDGDRVIFHVGSPVKLERQQAFLQVQKNLDNFLRKFSDIGPNILLAPETMGKKNQIGTLQEIVELCKLSKRLIPTVDFGHLHAAQNGGFENMDDYLHTYEYMAKHLGEEILYNFHVHFSKIEFTKAGEKKHWTFADDYGPPYQPFIDSLVKTGYTPRIICESSGTQAIDALAMQAYYIQRTTN